MRDADIHTVLRLVRRTIRQWPDPVVGIVARESGCDPFRILIATVLSLRTKDKTTAEASARLFAEADTPAAVLKLERAHLERLIYPVGFYRTKAGQIQQICECLLKECGGQVPDEINALVDLPGVGRKTANLVVTVGFKKPGICVDIHVHRISNRWGYIATRTPDESETALRKKLPRRHWITYNDLLVPFGQYLCQPVSPFCSRCPVRDYCARVGVTTSR
ncbi:MAG: endonuclease III [Nitrospiraceae bacterium]